MIYHLVEDDVYEAHMQSLFTAGDQYVIVYSSDTEPNAKTSPHVRHRRFTDWVADSAASRWQLVNRVPNDYPGSETGDPKTVSFAEFFIFEKRPNQ